MDHLTHCPALGQFHQSVEHAFLNTIASWGILPLGKRIQTDKITKSTTWALQAEEHLRHLCSDRRLNFLTPSSKTLRQLANDYYDTTQGRKRGATAFLNAVEQSIARFACDCAGPHSCPIRNCWGTPASLSELFQREFSLQVDGTADAVHRSQLPQWFSAEKSDADFGGKFDILSQDLRGLNILINPPFSQQRIDPLTGKADHIIIRIIDKLCATKNSELPTRAVIIVPALPGPGGDRFRQYAREKKLIEFLDFPPDSLRFQAPQSFAHEQPYFPGAYKSSVSVFLFMNNRSLRDWLLRHCPEGKIVSEADKKFGERLMSKAPLRQSIIVSQTCPVLTLMSALPQKQCQRSLRKQVGKRLKEVNAINNGYRQAATIGLFPHALSNMVKEKYPTENLSMMDNLSRMVIRVCAARFQEYQRLTIISEAHRTADGKPNVHNVSIPSIF